LKSSILTSVLLALLLAAAHASAQPSPLPPMRTTQVFGQTIRYYDVGAGPTVVLLHGLGSRAAFDWAPIIAPLAKHHRVLAMDQIGFGDSDKPIIDFSIQTWVDFLGELLRQQNISHFTLAGESLGGWIAATYTIQALHPATNTYPLPAPDRLILSDAAGHFHPLPADFVNNLCPGSLQAAKESLAHVFYDKSIVTDAMARSAFETRLAAHDSFTVRSIIPISANRAESLDDKLDGITIPTLIFWGQNDEIVPLADGYDFNKKIPGSKLIVVPECGHAPEIEKPQVYLDAVHTFLNDPKD